MPLTFFSNLVTPDFCGHDALLRLENGGHAGDDPPENHHHADSPGLSVCILPLMGAMMLIRTIQVMYQDFELEQPRRPERNCRESNGCPDIERDVLGDLHPYGNESYHHPADSAGLHGHLHSGFHVPVFHRGAGISSFLPICRCCCWPKPFSEHGQVRPGGGAVFHPCAATS
jgi:hypothetical protein